MNRIDDYLGELERELRASGSDSRILDEARDHLLEAAQAVGEEEALRRFGTPAEVALGFRRHGAARAARWAAGLLVAALAVGFLALYPIPENVLPPATWDTNEPPAHLRWKQDAVSQLFFSGLAAGLGAVLVGRGLGRRARLPDGLPGGAALTLAGVSLLCLLAMLVLGCALNYEWQQAAPGAPGPIWIAAYGAFQLALLASAARFLARAARLHG